MTTVKHASCGWRYVVSLSLLGMLFVVGSFFAAIRGGSLSPETQKLWAVLFQTILAFWVRADRRTRLFRVPYEFDAFVFFAWPVLLPCYFYRTRGGLGLLSAFGVYTLFVAPLVISAIANALYRL